MRIQFKINVEDCFMAFFAGNSGRTGMKKRKNNYHHLTAFNGKFSSAAIH
jgi:hypothetical protein